MPRSNTVWAAALVLASFSGSGPLLITAEAMPAPGPQQTQGRPRYYFPRHVKRQIVTNSTAPAAPTPPSLSSSSSSQLESRQGIDISSFISSVMDNLDSSNLLSSSTGAVTIVTPIPDPPSPNQPEDEGPSPPRLPELIPTLPELIPAPPSPPEPPSASETSSFQGPFIVSGSSSVQPTPSSDPVGGLLSSILDPIVGPTGILPSSILQPTPTLESPSETASSVIQTSPGGIVVGITTALGTGAPSPTPGPGSPSSGGIPSSDVLLPDPVDLPPILSSVLSEIPGLLPSGPAGPTDPASPAPTPAPTPSGILPPILSSLVNDVSSLLESAVPLPGSVVPSIVSSLLSDLPTPTGAVPLPPLSSILSSVLSEITPSSVLPSPSDTLPSLSGIVPSASDAVPTPSGIFPSPSDGLPKPSGSVPTPSETPSVSIGIPTPSKTLVPTPSGIATPSGILPPSGTGTGVYSVVTPTPAPKPSSVPAFEVPSSAPGTPNSATLVPSTPASTPLVTELPPVVTTPTLPTAVQSQLPTGSDSASSLVVGPSIIMEPTPISGVAPSATAMPSGLPRMISPPGGVPAIMPADSFLGQVCFKWQLNYNFVSREDVGRQIFHFLPMAIADALNITTDEVHNIALRPLDTTKDNGFITTTAVFAIPKDLSNKLQAMLRNPADAFWHNQNPTVNELTGLINTACPLPAGRLPGDSTAPDQVGGSGSSTDGGSGDGGAIGGDIGKSQPINKSSAGIAAGAIVGAMAYGAAMFFVARRYRNKRVAHQRASSVPSTGSRMTYGSIPGGAAAWMHGARNGRITPGSRSSQGSNSSQGPSVRTQQISAPVMAENSLGWN